MLGCILGGFMVCRAGRGKINGKAAKLGLGMRLGSRHLKSNIIVLLLV